MTHDFVKSAQRHRQQLKRENQKKAAPKSLIVFTLLAASGFAAFLYYLTQVQPELKSTNQAFITKTRQPQPEPLSKHEEANTESSFDFYTLLPESEVIAPKVDAYTYKNKTDTLKNAAYMLQAGSFRSRYDADRLRAKLILSGLDVQISRVSGKNKEYWHRVLVGPFTSRSLLNQAQDILARANTQTLVLKVKR